MHQRVMIRPTADAVEPSLEEFELGVAELAIEFLQQEHGDYLFVQHRAQEKAIGDLDQKIEPALFSHFPAKTDSGAAQIWRVPAVRFDFIFEEPLHARGMLGRAAVFQYAANVSGDSGGRGLELRHFIPPVRRGRKSIATPSWPRQPRPPTTRPDRAGASLRQSDA